MTDQKLAKDDVIWVPYRQDPLWPALVNNVYPKKVTYFFFPLPTDGVIQKKNTFRCHPKHAYALDVNEPIAREAGKELVDAFRAASEYLERHGKTRGSRIESLGEAMAREEEGAEKWRKKRVGTKRRVQRNEEDVPTSSQKPPSASSSPSISGHAPRPPITSEQSKQMMQLIDDRFETLLTEILRNTDDLKKAGMQEKMTVKLRNNQFLSDADYEHLFERLVEHIRRLHPEISLITAFSFTASHAIPHVLCATYATWKNVEIDVAREIFYQFNTRVVGLDTAMDIPVTNQMEELCRLACDEHNHI